MAEQLQSRRSSIRSDPVGQFEALEAEHRQEAQMHHRELHAIRTEVASAVHLTERREARQDTRIRNLESEKAQEKEGRKREKQARIAASTLAETQKRELEQERAAAAARGQGNSVRRQNELHACEKDIQALVAGPEVARGRPRIRVEAIREFILSSHCSRNSLVNDLIPSSSCSRQAPAYWQSIITAEKQVSSTLRTQLEAAAAKIEELEKQAHFAPKCLIKRTCMPLTNPTTKVRAGESTPRNYKNMSYGVDVQQFFINVAAVGNVPPRSLERIVREFYALHFSHLTEGKDYEIPTTTYLNDSGWMAGQQAETCAAWEFGQAKEACAGLDGSTKDNFHLMNANHRVRTQAEIDAGEKGRDVVMRGPTIAPKGNGSGGAESQRDFCKEVSMCMCVLSAHHA
jgi:hypothetical protein